MYTNSVLLFRITIYYFVFLFYGKYLVRQNRTIDIDNQRNSHSPTQNRWTSFQNRFDTNTCTLSSQWSTEYQSKVIRMRWSCPTCDIRCGVYEKQSKCNILIIYTIIFLTEKNMIWVWGQIELTKRCYIMIRRYCLLVNRSRPNSRSILFLNKYWTLKRVELII